MCEPVQIGDEIKAYVDTVEVNNGCVGKCEVVNSGIYTIMALYIDDNTTPEKDGIEDGDTIKFMICHDGIEYDCIESPIWTVTDQFDHLGGL